MPHVFINRQDRDALFEIFKLMTGFDPDTNVLSGSIHIDGWAGSGFNVEFEAINDEKQIVTQSYHFTPARNVTGGRK